MLCEAGRWLCKWQDSLLSSTTCRGVEIRTGSCSGQVIKHQKVADDLWLLSVESQRLQNKVMELVWDEKLVLPVFFPFTWLVLRWDWGGDVARVARGWGNWQRSSFKTIGMGSQDFNSIRGQRSGLTLVFCSLLALDGYPNDHGYQFGDLSRNTIVHPQLWRRLCVAEIHGNFQPDT